MSHIYDVSERARHEQVAAQLHALADQLAAGAVELAYDEWHAPTTVCDPVEVVVDLQRKRHHVELMVNMRWPSGIGEG